MTLFKKKSKKKGMAPGEVVYMGDKKTEKVRLTVIDYDENNFQEKQLEKVDDCFPFRDTASISWINIDGIHDAELVKKIGAHFNMHSLIMEDIVTLGQRPKIDIFDEHIFLVLKMMSYDEKTNEVQTEQVSIVFGKNFVISFQESDAWDVFNAIRERIRTNKGKIRKMGADYLAYSLVDSIVDNYFMILEKVGEKTEYLEEELIDNPKPKTLQAIHKLKREVIFLRKSVWPLREIINSMTREESALITATTEIYFRDVYDHTIQVIDAVETVRDILSEMVDIYLSSISNKMNSVMKVLTIIATIFMPLTFIVGVYGTNFKYFPELEWKYGYFMMWSIMILITLGMLYFFRRKGWL